MVAHGIPTIASYSGGCWTRGNIQISWEEELKPPHYCWEHLLVSSLFTNTTENFLQCFFVDNFHSPSKSYYFLSLEISLLLVLWRKLARLWWNNYKMPKKFKTPISIRNMPLDENNYDKITNHCATPSTSVSSNTLYWWSFTTTKNIFNHGWKRDITIGRGLW